MSTNGDDRAPPLDEPDWGAHSQRALQLSDPIAQGVALEAIERDRITFEDRKRFLSRYEHDVRAQKRANAAMASGLAEIMKSQKGDREALDLAIGLMRGMAERSGVTEAQVDAVIEEQRSARVRDTVTTARVAAVAARLEDVAGRTSLISEDTKKNLAAVTMAAADAAIAAADAKIEHAKVTQQLSVEVDARRSHHDDDRADEAARYARREAKKARRWMVVSGALLAVIGAGLALASKYLEPRAAPPPASAPALSAPAK